MKIFGPFVTFIFLLTLFLSLKTQASSGHWQEGRVYDLQGSLSYDVYIPEKLSDSPAVLLGLHGCMQGPKSFATGAGLEKMADASGSVLVVPNQPELSNIYKCWNWFFPHHLKGMGEIHLMAKITRQVMREYEAEQAFVFGISAGAATTQILATCYSDLFRASASHHSLSFGAAKGPWDAQDVFFEGPSRSAYESAILAQSCRQFARSPKRKRVPALIIQGTKGTMSPEYGPVVEQQWLIYNDLIDNNARDNSLHLTTKTQRFSPPKLYPYESKQWLTQDQRVLLEHITIEGLGHSWSGGDNTFDFNDPHGPSATNLMLKFFRHWGL